MSPEQVIKELRKRELPVWRTGDIMHSDEELHEVFDSARRGGWNTSMKIRARHINLGRLLKAQEIS